MPREPMPDIVVLLPGILGSVLKRDGRTVWGFSGRQIGRTILTRGRQITRDLWIEDDDPALDDLGDGVTAHDLMPDLHLLPGLWKIDGYSAIRRTIESHFEVTEGENFFAFPYDWRRDNRASARRLARESHRWLKRRREQVNRDAQLILIGHSMGGLVARYFLEVLEGWKDTRALITFGTPYRGSLNALDTLVNGMKMGPMGLFDLTSLARQLPSLYQLLPIYRVFDSGEDELERVGETEGIPNLDAARARSALEDFHRAMVKAQETNQNHPAYEAKGTWVYPIVGIGQETSQSARAVAGGIEILKSYEGRDMSGDGTVPKVSAVPPEHGARGNQMFSGTKHAAIQNSDPVRVHLTGVIESLYFDLGDFMRPTTPRRKIALEVDDLVWAGDPVRIRARTAESTGPLHALLSSHDGEGEGQRIELTSEEDGWRVGRFDPPGPGAYTVRVEGSGGAEPVSDVLAVADLTEAEAESPSADDEPTDRYQGAT